MQAPYDLTVTLNIPIGGKAVMAKIPFLKNQNVKSVTHLFCLEEDIPSHLENNILTTIEQFMEEAIELHEDELDEKAVVDIRMCKDGARSWHYAIQNGSLDKSKTNLESPRSTGLSLRDTFSVAYSFLVGAGSRVRSTLFQLENSYTISISELLHTKSLALASLQERQAEEMEVAVKAAGTDTDVLSEFVKKHLTELENVEKQYDKEMDELKAKQRTEYRSFVRECFIGEKEKEKKRIAEGWNNLESDESEDELEKIETESVQQQQQQPLNNEIAGGVQEMVLDRIGKATSFFTFGFVGGGKVATETPAATPSTPPTLLSRASPSPLYNSEPIVQKPFIFNFSTFPSVSDAVAIYLGRQIKSQYTFRIALGNFGDVLKEKNFTETGVKKLERLRIKMARTLYGEHISAAVLLVDENLTYSSYVCKGFIKACNASTEFHFESVKSQIQQVINVALQNGNKAGDQVALKPGDFFVTKHSNLSEVHIVFHLVSDSNPNLASDDSLSMGLRNIILTATRCGVAALTIPMCLTVSEEDSMTEDLQLAKRAEAVLRSTKAALATTENSETLQFIQFIVPLGHGENNQNNPLYKKVRALVVPNVSNPLSPNRGK